MRVFTVVQYIPGCDGMGSDNFVEYMRFLAKDQEDAENQFKTHYGEARNFFIREETEMGNVYASLSEGEAEENDYLDEDDYPYDDYGYESNMPCDTYGMCAGSSCSRYYECHKS